MKHLLATTALVAALGSTAFAQSTQNDALLDYQVEATQDLAASNLIGMRIYASETDMEDDDTFAAGDDQEWDDLGEINDVYLTRDGDVAAVILGIGGFLGIGERDVAVDMERISFVREEGESEDFFLVINATQNDLENAPAFERHDDMEMGMSDDTTMQGGETNTRAENDTAMMSDSETEQMRERFTRPTIERDGYVEAERAELTTEMLTGTSVYDVNDEDIGEVSELTLSEDGMVETVIIDVGGFLGLGEKPIAVSFDELQIMRTEDGMDMRVYIDASEEQLEDQPSYTG